MDHPKNRQIHLTNKRTEIHPYPLSQRRITHYIGREKIHIYWGAFYPTNLSGYTFNSIQSSDFSSNIINEGVRNITPAEDIFVASRAVVTDMNILKFGSNGKIKNDLSSEIPEEQPTIFAYGKLYFLCSGSTCSHRETIRK